MVYQKTFSIIKPDAVSKNQIGAINHRINALGLRIIAARMEHLTREKAEQLYAVHQGRDFFDNLVKFITSGPVMLQVLAGDNAISRYRQLMGSTDYKKAAPHTLRADFASSLVENAVHGSDSPESAAYEISLFFKENEIFETQP